MPKQITLVLTVHDDLVPEEIDALTQRIPALVDEVLSVDEIHHEKMTEDSD